jgi:hypothetical protein
MSTIDYRYAVIKERQPRYRAEAEHAREAEAVQRPIRHRVGESIIRFGQKVAGDAGRDALFDPSASA